MTTPEILKALGSDSIEPTAELFAAAAKDPGVIEALKALVAKAVANPRSIAGRELNLVSWTPYVFAENGSPELAPALIALLDQKADDARKFAGAYADLDLPVVFLRLAGKDVVPMFDRLVQTYRGAAELRAPLRAAAAAWAHGLISREEALAPVVAELSRMCDEGYADIQDDEWFDALLDVILETGPAGLEDALEAFGEFWDLQDDWDTELAEALAEPETALRERLRAMYPILNYAVDFVSRWDEIDAADGE